MRLLLALARLFLMLMLVSRRNERWLSNMYLGC